MALIQTSRTKQPVKKSLYKQCELEIDRFTTNMELHNKLREYLYLRFSMKDKPVYGVGQWKGLLGKLNELSTDTHTQIEIVKQSIERGWGTFVELNQSYSKNNFGEYEGMSCSKDDDEEIRGYF